MSMVTNEQISTWLQELEANGQRNSYLHSVLTELQQWRAHGGLLEQPVKDPSAGETWRDRPAML